MSRAERNWERLVRSALSGGQGPGGVTGGLSAAVPSSLNTANIDAILKTADEIQEEDPNVARILCEHAYALAQNLDPNSEGRGVLQFKTGLMSVIKQKLAKRDGATINRSQDIAYIQEFYKQYREKHRLDELQEEEMKMQASGAFSGDHKELERRAFNMKRVYATLKVLGDVVEALTNEAAPEGADTLIPEQLKKIIKSDAEKTEGLYAYNIVPLDAPAVANATMSFSEVKATALAANESYSVTHHVALASQESILVVGLICCDGEGRLNGQSVLLEGSAEFSSGHRVILDLQKLLKYSVFPGQVIGVEGHNLSGHCLVASRVIDSTKMP